jgi:multimeric flavodoxin WrbA
MAMKVLFLKCTMRKSPIVSNTRALVDKAVAISKETGVEIKVIRVVDHILAFGISSDGGEGNEWPFILEKIKAYEILFIATTIWLGVLSSVSKMFMKEWMGLA